MLTLGLLPSGCDKSHQDIFPSNETPAERIIEINGTILEPGNAISAKDNYAAIMTSQNGYSSIRIQFPKEINNELKVYTTAVAAFPDSQESCSVADIYLIKNEQKYQVGSINGCNVEERVFDISEQSRNSGGGINEILIEQKSSGIIGIDFISHLSD